MGVVVFFSRTVVVAVCLFFVSLVFSLVRKNCFPFSHDFHSLCFWCVLKLCNGPHQASSQCSIPCLCSFFFSLYFVSKKKICIWIFMPISRMRFCDQWSHNSITHRERQIILSSNFIESILSHAHNRRKKEEIERKSEKRAIKSLRFRIS